MEDLHKIFTKVKGHLLAQGCRSAGDPGTGFTGCRYRGLENTKCAVGFLIKDKFYTPSIEGQSVQNSEVFSVVKLSLMEDGYHNPDYSTLKGLLMDLQAMHDQSKVEDWGVELDALEKQYFTKQVS